MMLELLDMGRHSLFVWTSYGLVFLLFVILAFCTIRRQRTLEKELETLKLERPRRSGASESDAS